MTRWNLVAHALSMAPLALASSLALSPALGCALEPVDEEEISVAEQEVKPPKACPAILILCIEGYHPKTVGDCNQICVPDQGWECSTDADCGAIYCITTPCPQPVCRGHQCTIPNTPPSAGQVCGNIHCGKNQYCCNASCGICAPLDGGCIQIACMQI